jgi:hypothetical protein
MAVRLPGAWTVAAVAALAGAAVGAAGAVLRSGLTPWQVGELAVVSGPISADAPQAEPVETKHTFGTIGTGMSGSHRFEIQNVGGGPLTLSRGSSSCSCTVSDFEAEAGGSPDSRKVVPPGESTFVTVTWQGKPPGGPFRQRVTILSDDPRRPEIVFAVEGTVVPTWRAVPESITLPQLATSAGGQSTAVIYTYGDEPPSVRELTIDEPETASLFSLASVPLSAAEVAAEAGATGGFRIELVVSPGLPLGPLKRMITARFAMPEEVTAELPLVGTVGGDLVLAGPGWDSSRQALLLGTVSGRTGFKRRIFLTAKGPHRDQVRPVVRETVPDTLEVTIGQAAPVGAGGVLRIPIDIAIRPGSRGSNHLCSEQGPAGRIVLDTGHPESPELSIPVCIAVGP